LASIFWVLNNFVTLLGYPGEILTLFLAGFPWIYWVCCGDGSLWVAKDARKRDGSTRFLRKLETIFNLIRYTSPPRGGERGGLEKSLY
jgi:hypothetical protein